jgi:hypothetical protein
MPVTLLGHITIPEDESDFTFERIFSISNMDVMDRVPIDAEGALEDDVVCPSIEG